MQPHPYWSPHRCNVASRIIAAVVGGYALAASLSIFLSRLLPLPRANAVMTAMLLSFCVYAAAVLWVFAARSLRRAWFGVIGPAVTFGLLAWFAGQAGMQ